MTERPFAQAKEVVGGYAVLEAQARDEALEAARAFLRLHQQHWPSWQGDCEIRQPVILRTRERVDCPPCSAVTRQERRHAS